MKIFFDLDGVLIPESEKIFYGELRKITSISQSDYISNYLINGRKISDTLKEEDKRKLEENYCDRILTHLATSSANLSINTTLLRFLRSTDYVQSCLNGDLKLFLVSSTSSQVGSRILKKLNWENIFAEVFWDSPKFNNPSFYEELLKGVFCISPKKVYFRIIHSGSV